MDAATGSALPGAVVYLWHGTAESRYSLYEIGDENLLCGVQVADNSRRITFTSIFPGFCARRWPHAHFEDATAGTSAIKTIPASASRG